jgi:hypothetical protein
MISIVTVFRKLVRNEELIQIVKLTLARKEKNKTLVKSNILAPF